MFVCAKLTFGCFPRSLLIHFTPRYFVSLKLLQYDVKFRLLHSCNGDNKKFFLKNHLYNKIRTTGPISVAEFMKTALTSREAGYYMQKDVFGVDGDFVTSPELSQMFGELIAAWIINEWNVFNKPSKIHIVELGPGRGTLCVDILRTFDQLKHVWDGSELSIHLVEISPALSRIQYQNICGKIAADSAQVDSLLEGHSDCGVPIMWYETLDEVCTDGWTVYLAHEFFDALPIHKFVKINDVWKEIYVDIDKDSHETSFQFVVMNNPTYASKTLIQADEHRKHIEVSPEAALVCQKIAKNIAKSAGVALIADYGHFGSKEDTLRAFKQHKQVDVFSDVGKSDITADVDFKYLLDNCKIDGIHAAGPLSQRNFLCNLGIDTRLMMLLRNTSDQELCRKLTGSYDMIMNPEKMGNRFQFVALSSCSRLKGKPHVEITGFV